MLNRILLVLMLRIVSFTLAINPILFNAYSIHWNHVYTYGMQRVWKNRRHHNRRIEFDSLFLLLYFYCFEPNSIVKWWKQKAFLSWKTVIFRSVWFDMIMKMLVLWVVLLMRDCRWNNKTKKVLFYSIALHGIWKIMIMKQWHILPFSSWFCWFGSFSLTHTLVSSSQFWMFCHESCDNIIIRIDNYLYRHEKWILLLTA